MVLVSDATCPYDVGWWGRAAQLVTVLSMKVVELLVYGMYPRMPNFRNDNIPGCLLEALVLNARGDDVLDSPEIFFEAAKTCGYKTLLIRHPDDS